jgi:hypothetical protein
VGRTRRTINRAVITSLPENAVQVVSATSAPETSGEDSQHGIGVHASSAMASMASMAARIFLVLPGGHGELDPELDRGAEHGAAVEGAVRADRQLAGRPSVTDPGHRLGQERLRAPRRAR